MQLTSELAGMGGNIGYLKNEIFFQDNFSLFEDIVSGFFDLLTETKQTIFLRVKLGYRNQIWVVFGPLGKMCSKPIQSKILIGLP